MLSVRLTEHTKGNAMHARRIASLATAAILATTAITALSVTSAHAAYTSGQTGCIRYLVDTNTYYNEVGHQVTTQSLSYTNVCSYSVKAAVKYTVIPGIVWSGSCLTLSPRQTRYWLGGTPNARWFAGIKTPC